MKGVWSFPPKKLICIQFFGKLTKNRLAPLLGNLINSNISIQLFCRLCNKTPILLVGNIIVCGNDGCEIEDYGLGGKKDDEMNYEDESSVETVEDDYTGSSHEDAFVSELPVQNKDEEDTIPLPISTGTSRALTLQDILSGLDMDSPLPPHLQLSLAPNMTALNLTSNVTAESKKIICRPRNVSAANETDLYVPMVKLVTSKELLNRLSITNDTHANCIVVMFYAPWCPFCAKVAPHFNALPKVFPQIDFMAIDAINYNK